MKAKDLIKILNSVNPDSEISLTLGTDRDYEYRKECAKAELVSEECLNFLVIDKVVINNDGKDGDDLWADIVLKQDNIIRLNDFVRDFDKIYTDTRYELLKECDNK